MFLGDREIAIGGYILVSTRIRTTRLVGAKGRTKSSEASLPPNVIDFAEFLGRRNPVDTHTVYYLNESGTWLDPLVSFPFLHVEDINSMEQLKTRLLSRTPDLIFIEAKLSWVDPISTISLLSSLVEAPIVMVCESSGDSAPLIKQAYAAGVHDTLYAPLRRDDLFETLEVLLKLRRSAPLQP